MSKPARNCGFRGGMSRVSRLLIMIGVTVSVAGCSSAVSRFDFPVFGLNNEKDDTTASLRPQPSQSVYGNGSSRLSQVDPGTNYGSGNYSSYEKGRAPVEPVQRYPGSNGSYRTDNRPYQRTAAIDPGTYTRSEARSRSLTQAVPAKPARVATADGGWITVQPGDTLYSLSRRYGVPMSRMMSVNNLPDTNIHIGQRIAIPGQQKSAPVTYRIQQGDTMYSISRKLGVGQAEIARANGISDPTRIKPGQVLTVPDGAQQTATRVASSGRTNVKTTAATRRGNYSDQTVRRVKTQTVTPANRTTTTAGRSVPAPARKQVDKPRHKRVASLRKLPKPQPRTSKRFRWPVKGRIISKFGAKSNGSHNDGINVAVPAGTSVKAVENGVVAYAGNELKGYGNLILIRHADNWVSAYAHNSKILVSRGDKITRGQIVAKAGKTGAVNQPQVHFELRKGSKPVDPLKHMAGI